MHCPLLGRSGRQPGRPEGRHRLMTDLNRSTAAGTVEPRPGGRGRLRRNRDRVRPLRGLVTRSADSRSSLRNPNRATTDPKTWSGSCPRTPDQRRELPPTRRLWRSPGCRTTPPGSDRPPVGVGGAGPSPWMAAAVLGDRSRPTCWPVASERQHSPRCSPFGFTSSDSPRVPCRTREGDPAVEAVIRQVSRISSIRARTSSSRRSSTSNAAMFSVTWLGRLAPVMTDVTLGFEAHQAMAS